MELSLLSDHLGFVAQNGVTLHTEEKTNIILAMDQLRSEIKFEQLRFWGKVEGK